MQTSEKAKALILARGDFDVCLFCSFICIGYCRFEPIYLYRIELFNVKFTTNASKRMYMETRMEKKRKSSYGSHAKKE